MEAVILRAVLRLPSYPVLVDAVILRAVLRPSSHPVLADAVILRAGLRPSSHPVLVDAVILRAVLRPSSHPVLVDAVILRAVLRPSSHPNLVDAVTLRAGLRLSSLFSPSLGTYNNVISRPKSFHVDIEYFAASAVTTLSGDNRQRQRERGRVACRAEPWGAERTSVLNVATFCPRAPQSNSVLTLRHGSVSLNW